MSTKTSKHQIVITKLHLYGSNYAGKNNFRHVTYSTDLTTWLSWQNVGASIYEAVGFSLPVTKHIFFQ